MAPIATNFAGCDGGVTEQLINYYTERAKGGAGLIIIENANVDYPVGLNGAVQLRLDDERYIPGLAMLREAIYDADPTCRVALQINHAGGATSSARTGGLQVVGPSAVPTKPNGETPRALTPPEIEALADKYSLAAKRAQKAGFDAVEIHGGIGYLLAQFLSPYFNKRTDDFGGTPEKRAKFPLMVIQKIRRLLGERFPILFRMNAEEFLEGGLTLAESKIYAKLLAEAKVDLLHITAGSAYSTDKHIEPMSYPQGWKAYLAAEIKKEVSIPVAAVGVIREAAIAEEILASEKSDFVVLGRAFIADPYWVNKSLSGKPVNRCISCNLCAARRLMQDIPVRCSVNPVVGREKEERTRLLKTITKKKILIAGGGPAGLHAAIEASKDGHQVILAEKENRLGGLSLIAAVPPDKEKVLWLIDDLVREVQKKYIDIRLETPITVEIINEINPDIVILAVGSEPCFPATWGHCEGTPVMLAEDVFQKAYKPTGITIAIIGGGSVGCECAEYLFGLNNTIHLYEMTADIATDYDPITRNAVLKNLTAKKVVIKTNCRVQEIKDGVVFYHSDGAELKEQADFIVFATGERKERSILAEIEQLKSLYQIFTIGDAFKAGKFFDAARQAYTIVNKIRNGN